MKDLYSKIKVISGKAIAPTDDTAVVSAIVDMQGLQSLLFLITTGTLADAGATFTALLEESNDSGLSGSNAVADADLKGTEAAASFTQADDNLVYKLGYRGNKRYVRLTVTPSGNAAAAPIGILAIGEPVLQPAA